MYSHIQYESFIQFKVSSKVGQNLTYAILKLLTTATMPCWPNTGTNS